MVWCHFTLPSKQAGVFHCSLIGLNKFYLHEHCNTYNGQLQLFYPNHGFSIECFFPCRHIKTSCQIITASFWFADGSKHYHEKCTHVNDRLILCILLCVLFENIGHIGISPKYSSLIAAYGLFFSNEWYLSCQTCLDMGPRFWGFNHGTAKFIHLVKIALSFCLSLHIYIIAVWHKLPKAHDLVNTT